MPTADDALNVARSYLGEGPQRFTDWYPASTSTPWCCIFQSYVATRIGLPTHYAWVSGLFDAMRAQGRTTTNTRTATPGAYVAFDYDGGGASAYDHIAMVEYVETDPSGNPTALVCLNGNWENRVQRVRHQFDRSGYAGGIAEIAFPLYDNPTPTPEEDTMRDAIIRDPRTGAVYRITQPGNVAIHLSPPAYADVMNAVAAGLVTDLGNVSPATLGNFGILPSILDVKG